MIGRNEEGMETREIRTSAGVVIVQTRSGSEVLAYSWDDSGLGAVKCVWGIYTVVKSELELCPDAASPEIKRNLDRAIGRMNAFIVTNSLQPVTIGQIEEEVEKRAKNYRAERKRKIGKTPSRSRTNQCLSSFSLRIIRSMENLKDLERLNKQIDKLLSVPRLPVFNPCL